jgi:hypothetical protein
MGRLTNRIRPPAASTRLISSLRVTAERIRVVQVAPADSGAPPYQAHALPTSLTGPSRKPGEHATASSSTTHRSTIRKIRPDQLGRPALPLPYTLTRAVLGPLPSPVQPTRTRTHARQPEAHLEPHDRLAHHREQPRRQRDQLRREIRVRCTGGDRRRRRPVPREQRRHEQLEPLQQHLGSFGRAHALVE